MDAVIVSAVAAFLFCLNQDLQDFMINMINLLRGLSSDRTQKFKKSVLSGDRPREDIYGYFV